MTYCVKCGTKAGEGDLFCRSCGARLVDAPGAADAEPEKGTAAEPGVEGISLSREEAAEVLKADPRKAEPSGEKAAGTGDANQENAPDAEAAVQDAAEGETERHENEAEKEESAPEHRAEAAGSAEDGKGTGEVPRAGQQAGEKREGAHFLRKSAVCLMLLTVPLELMLPLALLIWSDAAVTLAASESAIVLLAMAVALLLDKSKRQPLSILVSFAIAACFTISFAHAGYPEQITAIASAMLHGLSTDAALSIFLSERGTDGAWLLLGINVFRIAPLVFFVSEARRLAGYSLKNAAVR